MAATTARSQPFGGIFANAGVTENGTVSMDSFDSLDPDHSIWQTNLVFRRNYFNPSGTQYGVWSNTLSFVSNSYPSRTANINVFAESNTVSVGGNVTIAGYVETGPDGTESLGASGTVGDLAWCYGPSGNGAGSYTGIEPGHWQQNVNAQFLSYPRPDPVNPVNGWMNWSNVPALGLGTHISIGGMWTNSAGVWSYVGGTLITNTTGSGFTINGTTYQYVITNRLRNTNWVYYSMSGLSHGQSLFIDAQYVVLYLTNGISYQSADTLTLNTNADVQIWSGGNISTTAQSMFNNLTGYAPAFSIFDVAGDPISVSLHSQTMVPGYYYLPSSSLAFQGGGDFIGAIVCYSVKIGGGTDIHFDESLGVNLPLTITQQPTNQIVEVGSNATFNLTTSGPPLGYQWFFSQGLVSNSIPGATNSSFTITNVQLTNAGSYSVVVSNLAAAMPSTRATLTVYTNPTPVLSGMLNPTNGQFQLSVTGVTGLNYSVQVSTNLINWVSVWTNTAPFSFTDLNAVVYPQRYYRSLFIQ